MGTETGPLQIRVGVVLSDPEGNRSGLATARALAPGGRFPTVSQLNYFCAALGAATRIEVVPHDVADYSDLLDAMVAGDVDLAWLPPVVALRAAARGKTVPVALPVRNGTPYYAAALFTRSDSPLEHLGDVSGVSAAWVDRQSAAGYLVIRASLRMRGLDLDRAFLSNTFCGTHAGVVRAVLEGEADVGATYALLDPRRSAPLRAGWGKAPVRMLATAGPIPADVVAVSTRLPVPQIRALQRALVRPQTESLARAAREMFSSEGFVEADSEHLDPLRNLLAHIDERPERSQVYALGRRRQHA